LTAALTAA